MAHSAAKIDRMWLDLSKIGPYFLYPLSLALALAMLGFSKRRFGRIALALSIALLWTASTPLVAKWFLRSLEMQYAPQEIAALPHADAIAVLAGALLAPVPPRMDFELGEGSDRPWYAARLFKAGKAPKVIVSGGNVFDQAGVQPEAYYIRIFMGELGVPAEAVILDAESRNTRENALQTKRLMDANGFGRVLLVTSAAHMPRALGAFRAAGIDAIPAPTDYRSVQYAGPLLLDILPSAEALSMFTSALNEYLGQAVYRMRGWM